MNGVSAGHFGRAARAGRARGVTLLEVLIVVGALALLLGLALPALRGARRATGDVADLANLRSTHQQFVQWGNDHNDAFLNAGPPTAPGGYVFDLGPGNGFMVAVYSAHSTYWPWVLARWLGEAHPTWHSTHMTIPEGEPSHARNIRNGQYVRESAYVYSLAMINGPAAFRPPACDAPGPHARYVAWHEAAFPSGKGLLYDSARPISEAGMEERTVVFVDGSAALKDWADSLVTPSGPPCGFEPVRRTPDGVLGRDF